MSNTVKAEPKNRFFSLVSITMGIGVKDWPDGSKTPETMVVEAGAELPFDPTDLVTAQAQGYTGLLEGVHWERGR